LELNESELTSEKLPISTLSKSVPIVFENTADVTESDNNLVATAVKYEKFKIAMV
jgi:hypothetical protein